MKDLKNIIAIFFTKERLCSIDDLIIFNFVNYNDWQAIFISQKNPRFPITNLSNKLQRSEKATITESAITA